MAESRKEEIIEENIEGLREEYKKLKYKENVEIIRWILTPLVVILAIIFKSASIDEDLKKKHLPYWYLSVIYFSGFIYFLYLWTEGGRKYKYDFNSTSLAVLPSIVSFFWYLIERWEPKERKYQIIKSILDRLCFFILLTPLWIVILIAISKNGLC